MYEVVQNCFLLTCLHNNCKVESPTTYLDLTLTHILFIFISFFERSSWPWVCYVKVYNTFLNSKGKGIIKRKDKEDKLSKSQNTWKKIIRPFTFKTHFFKFSICFELSKELWVHQLELYKTSFNSKNHIVMSKDFKF